MGLRDNRIDRPAVCSTPRRLRRRNHRTLAPAHAAPKKSGDEQHPETEFSHAVLRGSLNKKPKPQPPGGQTGVEQSLYAMPDYPKGGRNLVRFKKLVNVRPSGEVIEAINGGDDGPVAC